MKNSGNWVIGKVRIFGASKNPENEHFSGIIQKNGVFSGDLRKTSGGSFSDAAQLELQPRRRNNNKVINNRVLLNYCHHVK
jgi:hypothetical protein